MTTRLLLLIVLAVQAAAATPASPAGDSPRRVVHVTAERFEFFPSEIVVATGETIEIRLTSDDTTHGFRIVGAGTSLTVPQRGHGEVATVFVADKPGRYTFECTRMCGAGHHFMRGQIVVRDPRPGRTR